MPKESKSKIRERILVREFKKLNKVIFKDNFKSYAVWLSLVSITVTLLRLRNHKAGTWLFISLGISLIACLLLIYLYSLFEALSKFKTSIDNSFVSAEVIEEYNKQRGRPAVMVDITVKKLPEPRNIQFSLPSADEENIDNFELTGSIDALELERTYQNDWNFGHDN